MMKIRKILCAFRRKKGGQSNIYRVGIDGKGSAAIYFLQARRDQLSFFFPFSQNYGQL